MTSLTVAPKEIRIAVVVMVGASLVSLALRPSLLAAIGLALILVVGWFLLRANRVAWLIFLAEALAQLLGPFTMGLAVWLVGTSATVLVCLLSPAARAFVWTEAKLSGAARRSTMHDLHDRIVDRSYALLFRTRADSAGSRGEILPRIGRGKATLLLVASVLVLYPLTGLLYDLHHGSERGNVVIDVLWRVVWISYIFAVMAVIILLAVTVYHFVFRSRERLRS